MESLKFKLQNKGLSEYNDDVYEHSPFVIKDTEFDFLIQPDKSSNFWRFGLALSKTKDFNFQPNSGRYNNTDLKFIQLNIGDYKNKSWDSPHKLELQTYYFEEYNVPVQTFLNYKPNSSIGLKIYSDSSSENLNLYLSADENIYFNHSFNLKDYPFFKVFAWADEREFNISGELSIYERQNFSFPIVPLSNEVKEYLEIIYQKFTLGEQVESHHDIPYTWTEKLLHPEQISHLILQGGTNITLWGIWLIHPESKIFGKFDRVIFAIRKILSTGQSMKQITSKQIQMTVPNITKLEIYQIFELMGQLPDFHRGIGRQEENESTITVVGSNKLKDRYKDYKGLQQFLNQYLLDNGIQNVITDNLDINDSVPIVQLSILFKTRLLRRHRSRFNAVMGVQALAEDMANIIDDLPNERGQMIGIFGKWGRGKTFLLDEMVKKVKESEKFSYLPITYHAWKYQETPSSWAYLYEILAGEYFGKKDTFRSFFKYHWKVIKFNYKREEILPIILVILTIVFLSIGWIAFSNTFKNQLSALKWVIPVLTFIGYLRYLKSKLSTKAIDLIKRYTIRNSFKPVMGIQADIQEELIKLLQIWIPEEKANGKDIKLLPEKILLLVEDMDRCSEEKIIQNIDALRVMLEDDEISKRLVIITAIDERILKSAIRTKYAAFFRNKAADKNDNIHELVSEYLDKIFISAVKLGGLTSEQKKEYFTELTINDIKEVASESGRKKDSADSEEQNKNEKQKNSIKGGLDLLIQDGDLVIKDGDLAMEDEEGNIFSTADLDQMEEEQAAPRDGWEKLSPIEVRCLQDIIGKWHSVTPRRITIFYYRYLLCKNLLINKYIFLRIKNQWEDEEGIMNILRLIIYFSDLYDPDKISDEKNKIERAKSVEGPLVISDINISKPKIHIFYLLEILELIIAY